MDYPDEDEEFELQYQDELEMLEDMPSNPDENYVPVNHTNLPKTNSKILRTHDQTNSTLHSPQLSQISFAADNSQTQAFGGPVNRRLFGTPTGAQRVSSTPLTNKQQIAPLREVVGLPAVPEEPQEPFESEPLEALQSEGLKLRSKRRLERDLFGDIDDLFYSETYEDPLAKKARTEEERDKQMIDKILEARRKLGEVNHNHHKDELERLQALHAFKMRNLSERVPVWPALPLIRNNGTRIYVRFHSNDYETRAINEIHALPQFGGLLGDANEMVWAEANELILRNTALAQTQPAIAAPIVESTSNESAANEMLWVEKYKPCKYIDLLSDESTNRSLLQWLKMWDKIVFGREPKRRESKAESSKWSNFNTKTGKFEPNAVWRKRKGQQALNTNVDELGRPIQKVALLCGPPGLGKTTLAHTIARHAGYDVREVNASDDRSPEAFRLALENGTQMSSVLNEEARPNCIILDEIDGAPRQSIEFLVKFVSDGFATKTKARSKTKNKRNVLKRPIICICNDVYDPALRPLRLIAFVVTFPPIESARLAERLLQIARKEHLKSDFGSLISLADKAGNDVRCCLSTMQFFNVQKKTLTLQDVLSSNLGQKDRHQGLFDIWSAVFRIQRPRKQLQAGASEKEETVVTMTDMSVATRVRNVLQFVHAGDDYERLMQGVYENYLQQKMPDPNLSGVVEALQWFGFSDLLHQQINHLQNYTVHPYLRFGFVVWHLLFASLAWPKINFPTKGFEFHQKTVTQKNIFQALRRGISCSAMGIGQGSVILIDTVPLLRSILSPRLRSVAVQLLSPKEQYDLRHTVDVMVDLGLTYIQLKTAEGPSKFLMEPDLDILAQFSGFPGIELPYFSRKLIASEVEIERIRRATPKIDGKPTQEGGGVPQNQKGSSAANQLRPATKKGKKNAKDAVIRDFFGRIKKTVEQQKKEAKKDPVVKSHIWYHYKQGFDNAVRRDMYINELL